MKPILNYFPFGTDINILLYAYLNIVILLKITIYI